MTTLLDKQLSAARKVPSPNEATSDQVLSRIAALAPMVARLGPNIEQGRRLPAELVSALKSARIYSMLVPRRYGGLELHAPSATRAVAALARLDGSVGWNAMIGHIGALAPFLASANLCEQIYQDGKDHIMAGSGQPVGAAERVPGGWRFTGAWPFASGCQSAEWIAGTCVMMEGGSPIDSPDVRERLGEFALSLHPDKTRLIEFGRFAAVDRKRCGLGKPETFAFLGFTFICGKSRQGPFQLHRKTRRDRMRAKLKDIKAELRRRMHQPIPTQGLWLKQVVTGHFAYYAVPTNSRALSAFRHYVTDLWRRTLRRRSQKDGFTWERMTKLVDVWLPQPRILHPWPDDPVR